MGPRPAALVDDGLRLQVVTAGQPRPPRRQEDRRQRIVYGAQGAFASAPSRSPVSVLSAPSRTPPGMRVRSRRVGEPSGSPPRAPDSPCAGWSTLASVARKTMTERLASEILDAASNGLGARCGAVRTCTRWLINRASAHYRW